MKKLLKFVLFLPCFCNYQCSTQSKPLNLLSGESVDGSNTKNAGSVKDINALISYNGSARVIDVEEKNRGGRFELVHNAALQNDDGMIFPALDTKDAHWVRITAKDEAVNLKWYGAKGEGRPYYKDDSAALVKAIAFIAGKGGGKLYIPAATSFYAYNGIGILLPDNIEIYGDGDRSEIKHINPEIGGDFYRGVIFFTTSYGSTNFNGITRAPTSEIQDAKKGQTFIVAKNNEAGSGWKPGDLIGLGADYFFKKNLEFKARYSQFEINEITKISGDTVYLKYPLSINLLYAQPLKESETGELTKKGKQKKQNENAEKYAKQIQKNQNDLSGQNEKNSGSPVIIEISASKTYNDQFKAYDRISRNIYLHNFKLSQADYNMIKNTPYSASKQPNNVIGLGGTFESKFDHLTLEGVGTFGGNLWNRCEISNLTIYSQWKLVDFGYGSSNTKMHDINWIFKPTKIRDTTTALVYLNDGTHDIELYNIKVSGPWSLGNIFQLAGGAHNINVHDVEINLPQYDMAQGRAISVRDDNEQVYVHDVTFKNVTFNVKNIQFYINVNGVDIPNVNKNISFNGVHFNQQSEHNGNAVTVNNSRGIQFSDVSVPSGNIALFNVPECKISNIKAPNSNLVFSGDKPQIVNSVYKQIKMSSATNY